MERKKRISEEDYWGMGERGAGGDHSDLHHCQDEAFPHLPRLQALYLGKEGKVHVD